MLRYGSWTVRKIVAKSIESKSEAQPLRRYSISVTGATYDRLRALPETEESMQRFVDALIMSAIDDPLVRLRVLAKCHPVSDR